MAEPFSGGRWQSGSMQPDQVYTPPGYESQPRGDVRRAALRSPGGDLLGHVWTDDRKAAGFLPAESAGSAGVRAGSHVWTVHRRAHQAGRPASDVLDPALYAPTYRLGDTPGQRVDDALRRAARKK